MKLGLYGGSFDPIHLGHVLPVRHAMEALDLDQVLYLPTARPPHKGERELAPALARFTMVELALLAEPKMRVSTLEMDPAEVSYTVDTLRRIRRQQPRADLYLLLGSDSFLGLTSWREWRELAVLSTLAVMARPGWRVADLAPELAALVDGGKVRMVPPVVRVDASSSELRGQIAAGTPGLDAVMPKLVLDYIRKYEFYA